jgi:hypothetical protein
MSSLPPVELFYSYSHKDEELRDQLEIHLAMLKREGAIKSWHDRRISAGREWEGKIDEHLTSADLILLLVSSDFLASDYCYDVEVKRAMEKHEVGDARVIPIILRSCDWKSAPFGRFQALPKDAKPVTRWEDRDEAFLDITRGIRLVLKELISASRRSKTIVISGDVISGRKFLPLFEVFKPSGVPDVTFIEPEKFPLLKLALAQPGRGVVIEGPSGIGKTTALKKAVEQLLQSRQISGIKMLSARRPEDVHLLLSIQQWHKGVVSLDDFHRLNTQLRVQLIDYLKYLADYELPDKKLVIVGIPQTGRKLVQVAFDVATRIEVFQLGRVKDETIISMIEKGEEALNIRFDRKSDIARASGGSLNIAQLLCYQLTIQGKIERSQVTTKEIRCDVEMAVSHVLAQMSLKFEEVVRCFASLGGATDRTCIQILQELVRTEDGFLPLNPLKDRRPDLAKGIDRFIADDYVTTLYDKCPSSENHILFDETIPALIIDDPQLTFYILQTPLSHIARNAGKRAVPTRSKVLVSYSHADAMWLERLRVHLKPLERDGIIELWDDTRIQAGARWRQEIRKAIDSAKVALLLISADFLASDFIVENELPPLLASAKEEGTVILPLIVSPSRFTHTESLSQFQAVNDPSKPLVAMSRSQQEVLLVKVAEIIEEVLTSV